MKANRKLGKIKETIIFGRLLRGSLTATAVFVLAFVFVPYLIAEANASQNASVNMTWKQISLTLDPDYVAGGTSGSGDVDFGEVVPSSNTTAESGTNVGTQKVIKKTLRLVTTGNHYTVYLSMVGDNNNLNKTGDSTKTISAISDGTNYGTFEDPIAFDRTGWGYAVPGSPIDGAGFSEASVYAGYDSFLVDLAHPSNNNLTATGTGKDVYNHGLWAAVPVLADSTTSSNNITGAQLIWKNDNSAVNGFADGEEFVVYYSVMADLGVMAGEYRNQIIYTALASTGDLDEVSYNIDRDLEYGAAGMTETLQLDLASSPDSLLTNQVKVFMVPHREFVTGGSYAGYTKPNLTVSQAQAAYSECAVQTVASLGTSATITCTLPGELPEESENPTKVKIASNDGDENGEYDLWVHIDQFGDDGLNYISHYTSNGTDVASVYYIGLQSRKMVGSTLTPYITEMQEISTGVCRNTNMWGSTTGANAQIYDYRGESGANKKVNGMSADVAAGLASDALGVGTFALSDNRDDKLYLVRRLADGNCWMVQNLDLELADFVGKTDQNGGLTPANTDITASRFPNGYWDPAASTNTKVSDYATAIADAGITSSGFEALSTYLLGLAQTQQFQSYNIAGNHWGSLYGETGNATSGYVHNHDDVKASATNNSNAEIPRSYSNMETSDGSKSFNTATGFRYVAMSWETGKVRAQNMDGTTGWPTGAPGAFGTGAVDKTTMTATYMPTTRASSATGAAAGQSGGLAYEAAADDTYYGNMYIGHYYNWYAATAESGKYAHTSAGTATSATVKNVDDSICPKGWHLPENGTSGETAKQSQSWGNLLHNSYDVIDAEGTQSATNNRYENAYAPANEMHKLPLSIPFSGYYHWTNGALNNRGTFGYFWSSTPYSTAHARNLDFNSTYVYPQVSNNKVNGFTVRCVAR